MSQINDLQKIEKEASVLAQELGRQPTFEEVAASVDISRERTRNAIEVGQHDISFDAPAYLEEDTPLLSVFAVEEEGADEAMDKARMKEILASCLEVLDGREHRIVRAYFGLEEEDPMTLEQIGDAMGVTRERVRQLRNRALDKMRRHFGPLLVEYSSN
jgi:DNA-directed RNA polymerase sigma subunit (sigma70/sigma32)